MQIKRVKGGLLIPDEYLQKLGEDIEVISKPFEIIIRPKSVAHQVNPDKPLENSADQQDSPRKSSPRAILKHAGAWKGEDLEELLEEVIAFRGKFKTEPQTLTVVKVQDGKEYSNRALLEFIKNSDGWAGDDLEELLEQIS
jgi:hypothetical protein